MSPRQDYNTMALLDVGLERLATPNLMMMDDDDSSSSRSDDHDDCSEDDDDGPDWDWQTLETRTLEEEGYSHKHSNYEQYREQLSMSRHNRQKNVTFSSQTFVVEIICRNEFTPRELKACWYNLEDKVKMNVKHDKSVARFESGKAPKRNQTYRGLECWSKQGAKDLETAITKTIDAVMDEQDRQWMAFKDEHDRLAKVSIETSEPSKLLARELAKFDEQAVKEQYLEEEDETEYLHNGNYQDVSSSEVGSDRLDEMPVPVAPAPPDAVPVSPVSSASRRKKVQLRRGSSNISRSSSSGDKKRRRRRSTDKKSKSHSSKGGRRKLRSSSNSSTTGKADPPGSTVHDLSRTSSHTSTTKIVKLLPKQPQRTPTSLPARMA